MVEECQVGICCYANSAPSFRGILKQRYSDFIVHEVDPEGKVIVLSQLNAPDEGLKDSENHATSGCTGLNSTDAEKTVELFKGIAGEGNAELLKGLLDQIIEMQKAETQEENVTPIVLTPDPDKSHRTVIHNFFKSTLPFLVTDTVDGPESSSKCVRVRPLGKTLDGRRKRSRASQEKGSQNSKRQKHEVDQAFDSRGAERWPMQQEKYVQFHLYKENKDTQEALGILGKMLGIQSKSFGFAGTKDKRGVTTQRVTAFKVPASKLAALNKKLYGIKVGDFCYADKGLVLGQLSGNRFTITLRGIAAGTDEIIKDAADSLGKSGFINYFGLQRFGTSTVPTFTIGAALLRGEWEIAVNLILQPRDGERQDIKEAREYFAKTKDADGTFLRMPRQFFIERSVLISLRKNPGNFLQAITSIPRTMRMMYIHSYQSFLWNHAASKRLQIYGHGKVIEGDLVFCKDMQNDMIVKENSELLEMDNDPDNIIDEEGADIIEEMDSLSHVKHVTSGDVACMRYKMTDIVLPLLGCKTLLPMHDVSKVYDELAKKDGINFQHCPHNVKEFSLAHLPGRYRYLMQTVKDFDWKILKYDNPNMPLAETDWDRINGRTRSGVTFEHEEETRPPVPEVALNGGPTDDASGCQTALQVKFTLPSSCYATMAIRELLKVSSSVAFHKVLNEEPSEHMKLNH